MPLPHFLLLLITVVLAAALTIWVASAVGAPLLGLAVLLLMGAGVAHLATHMDR